MRRLKQAQLQADGSRLTYPAEGESGAAAHALQKLRQFQSGRSFARPIASRPYELPKNMVRAIGDWERSRYSSRLMRPRNYWKLIGSLVLCFCVAPSLRAFTLLG